MARIDHVAFETEDPDGVAAFFERMLGARVVKAEDHPVMAYLGNTGIALHERGGPGPHTAVRVSEQDEPRSAAASTRPGSIGASATTRSASACSSRIRTAG